jgi:NADH-quinone oxidoreductase subunit G
VISPQRAAALSVQSGDHLRISNTHGSITLPALVEDIHDDAVWLPRNSIGSTPLQTLNSVHGDLVTVVKA